MATGTERSDATSSSVWPSIAESKSTRRNFSGKSSIAQALGPLKRVMVPSKVVQAMKLEVRAEARMGALVLQHPEAAQNPFFLLALLILSGAAVLAIGLTLALAIGHRISNAITSLTRTARHSAALKVAGRPGPAASSRCSWSCIGQGPHPAQARLGGRSAARGDAGTSAAPADRQLVLTR